MKIIKHPPFKQGSRKHIIRWFGHVDHKGEMSGKEVCSEPDCEINKAVKG